MLLCVAICEERYLRCNSRTLKKPVFCFQEVAVYKTMSLAKWNYDSPSNILFLEPEIFSKGQKQVGLLRESRKQLPSIMVSSKSAFQVYFDYILKHSKAESE